MMSGFSAGEVATAALTETKHSLAGKASSSCSQRQGDTVAYDLPGHLVSLTSGDWAAWRWFVLRGAGFPVHMTSVFCDPECASAADRLLNSERAVESARSEAIQAVNLVLDSLRQLPSMEAQRDVFGAVVELLRALRSGRPISAAPLAELDPLLRTLEAREACRRVLDSEYEATFAEAIARQGDAASALARNPAFQEALVWQNRLAFETAIRPIIEKSAPRDRKRRQHEELVANYAQRYGMKNDTIGFFGPVGWGIVTSSGPTIQATPGSSLIARRRVYFEEWCVSAVAAAISAWDGMRRWIPPRLAPYVTVSDGLLHVPMNRPMPIDPLTEAMLGYCTGENAAGRLPELLRGGNPRFRDTSYSQIEPLLQALADRGLIAWRFIVPVESNPEIGLRAAFEKIGDNALRERALQVLDRIEEKRSCVAQSGGDIGLLGTALDDLDQTFREITGKEAQRRAGAVYAGRTLVYEDCSRNADVRVSRRLFEQVMPALSLVLTSTRWLVGSIAKVFQDILESSYSDIAAKLGVRDVPAALVWLNVAPLLDDVPQPVKELECLFEQKWSTIFSAGSGVRERRFNSLDLQATVETAFPTLTDTPFSPQYFCPDLMVAAPSVEAIERGEALYVMGELHLGHNTLASAVFVGQHPDAPALHEAVGWDFPLPRVWPITTRQQPRKTVRTTTVLLQQRDFLISATADSIPPTGLSAHRIGDLVVRKSGRDLLLSTRDGTHNFDVMEAFAAPLYMVVMNGASFLRRAEHAPRVLIDDVVISRESWTVPSGELAFAHEKEEHARFLGSRRWALSKGLPDIVFVKTPTELKPFCIHLDSPLYTEILCKMIRRVESSENGNRNLTFSEMLPRPDQCWLTDAQGWRYTSELRFTLVDLKTRASNLLGQRKNLDLV
jgi:hypothetical protein